MISPMKQRFTVISLIGFSIYFMLFLMFAFMPQQVLAGSPKTGFLVVAADRGFLGNQEINAVMEQFKQIQPASLALIGKNRQGIEGDYVDYIQRAVNELEKQGVKNIIAIPMFLSEMDATLKQYRKQITEIKGHAKIHWAPPMADSYLTAQILLDRVEVLSTDPAKEHLIVLGTGAVDEASEQRIKDDLEELIREVTDRHDFSEVAVHVYYNRGARDQEQKNEAVDESIIRTAAKRGRMLLVPFAIGAKFDQRMSMEGWLKRKFSEFDIALGESVFPHPDMLTWLKQTANRYLPALKNQVGVLIMPHGSTQPYNDGLEKVIAPLRKRYRVEVAPGMGDPLILSQAVQKLEQDGITRIIFVRMYALQESMKAKTDYILGLAKEPPAHQHGELPSRIRSSAVFETFGGYEEDLLIADILRERVLEISERPEDETVILLAHGTMGDKENQRWLDVINGNIEHIQQDLSLPFKAIKAMTLREDWPDKREQALIEVRKEIEKGNRDGGRVLIISNRLYGSGPYQSLLEGAEFEMNGQGLVPHPNITRWLEEGIEQATRAAILPNILSEEAVTAVVRNGQ
jgi:protoheme ferro-lyase